MASLMHKPHRRVMNPNVRHDVNLPYFYVLTSSMKYSLWLKMLALHLDIPALKSLGPGVILSFYPSMSQSDDAKICFFFFWEKKITFQSKF